MKYLSLQQAMLGMRVIMTDDGLILKSPAGSAHYDLKGRRHTVWGDASFFPEHMRVKDKRKPNLSRVVFEKDCTTIYGVDGKAKVRIGNWDNPEKPKGWRIQKDGLFITSHDFNPKGNFYENGQQYAAGMVVGIDVQKGNAAVNAYQFKSPIEAPDPITESVLENALSTHAANKNIQALINQQAKAIVEMKQGFAESVKKELAKHLRPGGLIWSALVKRNGRLDV
ncbi:hypothetical protein ACB286_00140 [Enterobacter cloacae]|nr:hypothetical protein [Escherichia coli]